MRYFKTGLQIKFGDVCRHVPKISQLNGCRNAQENYLYPLV